MKACECITRKSLSIVIKERECSEEIVWKSLAKALGMIENVDYKRKWAAKDGGLC